jgi:hypothetical protein
MRRPAAAALAALLLGACAEPDPTAVDAPLFARGGTPRAERGFEYTRIEVPGATFTAASGIAANGDIVGEFDDAHGVTRGFLLRRGEFDVIEFPGAAFTQARGIGPGGEIVGTYRLPNEAAPRFRSFLRTRNGEYSEITAPGWTNIMAQRILPDGTIVGCVHENDMSASMKGMRLGRHGLRLTDAFASMDNGATPDGRRIAGLYTNTAIPRAEAYIIQDGEFSPLVVPGSNLTQAWDMNAAGEVVGIQRLPGPPVRVLGFVYAADGFTTIEVPGAAATRAFGINNAGDVVGHYVQGGVVYGFVARRVGRS